MRSIRFTILVCFSSLLALALGVFSFLFYENARHRLAALQASTMQMTKASNQSNQALWEERLVVTEKTLRANFDASLLLRAQTLARNLTRQSSTRNLSWQVTLHVGDLFRVHAPAGGGAFLNPPIPLREFPRPPLPKDLKPGSLDLVIGEDRRGQTRDEQAAELYQVFNQEGVPLLPTRSRAGEHLSFAAGAEGRLMCLEHEYADIAFAGGKRLRQVTLKAPVVRLHFRYAARRDRHRAPNIVLVPVDPKDVQEGNVPLVFVQYARETAEVDNALAELREELKQTRDNLDEKLAQTLAVLDEDSRNALASLRTKLLLISLGVFGATVIGGVWLVRRGLAPLERLAAAVSQVSEKDFQLRIDQRKVPEELEPIVERLRQSLASLELAFAREKQAAADISHDLRTPIASLLATTQVCLRRVRSSEEYRAALDTCREIGQQMNVLVERLLALARLDAGADQLNPELVDVPELAEQCVSLVRPLAEQKGLDLRLERNGPIVVETDGNKLREVLTNLLDNAIQYNRPAGRVELAVDRNNGHVQFEVRDTGVGIPAEAKQHLFERFFRADPSRQSDTAHSGLGLAIVKGYVDLMGGKIEVDSVPGQGSTFRVLLPLPGAADNGLEATTS